MVNNSFSVVALDPATLKASFLNYLQSQPQYKDYNFAGSNFAVLLDILAYNSFINGFYDNMVASEMYLDSAQLRDSIVSNAKDLNYIPRSTLSSSASVSLKITTDDGSTSVVIPKYTTFTGRIGSNTYTFSTNTAYTAVSQNNVIFANNVTIYEGTLAIEQFVYNSANDDQQFILSNPNIDTSSLYVNIITNGGSQLVQYLQANSIFDINGNSAVYWLQSASGGQYQLLFGDDITGQQPADQSIISIEYRVSAGADTNMIQTFAIDGPIGNNQANVIITTNSNSAQGSWAESSKSIKFNAPRQFTTQERAITEADYETLMKNNFPEIVAISATGGEKLNPPQYGKVSLSILINGVESVPDSKIQQYTQYLSGRSCLTVTPIFTDPTRLYVQVNSLVNYNVNQTTADDNFIRTSVTNQIQLYNQQYLNNFNVILRYSQLVRAIDQTNQAIVGNETNLNVIIRLTPIGPTLNTIQSFTLPIQQGSVTSSPLMYNGQFVKIVDRGNGILSLITISNPTIISYVADIGTINYSTGQVIINSNIGYQDVAFIKLYATTTTLDIPVSGNVVLLVDPSDILINIMQVQQ